MKKRKKKDEQNKKIIVIYSPFIFVFLVARGRASLGETNVMGELTTVPLWVQKASLGYKTYPNSPISVHSPRSALG
jgi:hypothetical protein